MRRELALSIVMALVTMLGILAVVAHMVVYSLWEACVGTQAALAVMLAMLIMDAVVLARALMVVIGVYMGDDGEIED